MAPRWLTLALLCALAGGTLAAQARLIERSNVINKPCPELHIEEWMVQGPEIRQIDFKGKAVLFLFYMRACEGCELHAMPRLQKIYERYADSRCVLVLAINTAFDKEFAPFTADIAETRAHLRLKQWTMPVARDRDERSYALFEVNGESGTPQAVVLDETGKVVDHGWFSEKREMDRIERALDAVSDSLNCDCVRKPREVGAVCQRAYDAICEGDYSRAWKETEAVINFRKEGDKDRKDAEYLRRFVETLARDRMQRIEESFDYDPVDALARAGDVLDRFKGVAGVTGFEATVGTWRESDTLRDFVAIREELERVEGEIATRPEGISAEQREADAKSLNEIARRAEGTSLAERASRRASRLGGDAPAISRSGDRDSASKEAGKDAKREAGSPPSIKGRAENGRTIKRGASR